MTPMVPFLPSELIDSIVDHLHDDKETLRICSLVSHRWLPSCLFHLFHHLTYLALRGEGSFTPLIDFLDNGKHLRPRIRSLTLDGLNTQELCGRGQKSHGLSHPQLYRILCLLPALRSLELRKVSFRNIMDWTEHERQQFQERDPPGFSIENLTLDSTGQVQHLRLSASPFELDGIFSIFTSIGNLRMHNMAFFPTEHHWPSGYQHSGSQVGPDSVYIDGCSALYLPFICLEKRPPPRSLTVRSRDILSIGKYLRNVGCYLKDLDLDLEMGLDGQLSTLISLAYESKH